ncbi:hypothetical protein CA11_19210 [Gimesia maris]|nr:hypothetical protein CA11_19210 [Gimesia maris]
MLNRVTIDTELKKSESVFFSSCGKYNFIQAENNAVPPLSQHKTFGIILSFHETFFCTSSETSPPFRSPADMVFTLYLLHFIQNLTWSNLIHQAHLYSLSTHENVIWPQSDRV